MSDVTSYTVRQCRRKHNHDPGDGCKRASWDVFCGGGYLTDHGGLHGDEDAPSLCGWDGPYESAGVANWCGRMEALIESQRRDAQRLTVHTHGGQLF